MYVYNSAEDVPIVPMSRRQKTPTRANRTNDNVTQADIDEWQRRNSRPHYNHAARYSREVAPVQLVGVRDPQGRIHVIGYTGAGGGNTQPPPPSPQRNEQDKAKDKKNKAPPQASVNQSSQPGTSGRNYQEPSSRGRPARGGPSQGYPPQYANQPPQGYYPPPQGYNQPPQGYYPPPQGYYPAPQGPPARSGPGVGTTMAAAGAGALGVS